jgi:hypothetical protein
MHWVSLAHVIVFLGLITGLVCVGVGTDTFLSIGFVLGVSIQKIRYANPKTTYNVINNPYIAIKTTSVPAIYPLQKPHKNPMLV